MKAGIPVTDACSEGETMPSLTALPELLRFAARVGSSRTRHGVEIEKNAIAATAATDEGTTHCHFLDRPLARRRRADEISVRQVRHSAMCASNARRASESRPSLK